MPHDEPMPYFDFLLDKLAGNDKTVATSFGRHVHWGYWQDPAAAICDTPDLGRVQFPHLGKIGFPLTIELAIRNCLPRLENERSPLEELA